VPDAQGRWSGFNVDLCRAIAAVILEDASKIQAVPVTPQNRFAMLQSGEADLLIQNTTFTMSRDTQLRLNFAAITFYDAQAIMVPKKLNVDSALKLGGATVCVLPSTTNELNLNDYFQKHNMQFTPVVIDSRDDLFRAYGEGRCDAITSDGTTLAAQRLRLPVPADHILLPEPLSKEPLGIALQKGDDELRMIASWAFYTLVNAEELGVNQANVAEVAGSTKDPEIRRMLGVDKGLGAGMGVKDDFAVTMLKAVGNYGEIFERHLGPKTPVGLPRGLNRLWKDGGILYTPPNR
jgi:general L-amino acid transport system substrate-binding protein